MRFATFALLLSTFVLFGCSSKPELRTEPIDVKGTVRLPAGASPKDMTVTFMPQQNSPPGGSVIAADGSFTVKLVPGKYSVCFIEEANGKLPAYKSVPEKFRTADPENTVTVESSGTALTIEVK